MENQEDWLVLLGSNRLLDVFLVFGKKFRVKFDVTRLVNAMDIAKTSSNGEVWRDWRKSLVDGENILWLSVEGVVIDILVVNAILFATSDANLLELYVRYARLNGLAQALPSQAIASWAQHA